MSPRGPLVNTEFYPGWFDIWGQPHQRVNSSVVTGDLDAMLRMGANVTHLSRSGHRFGLSYKKKFHLLLNF